MRAAARLSVIVGILVMGAAVAATAQTQGGMQHPMQGGQAAGQMGRGQARPMTHGQGMEGMLAELNLTEAQSTQVHQLVSQAQANHKDVMERMQKLHEQLRDQVFADGGPADQEAKATAKQISDLMANMMQEQIDLHEQIAKVLDPAQRKKMREMPMGRFMGMMGPGMMDGPRRMPPPKK